jgi:hypothetical protein
MIRIFAISSSSTNVIETPCVRERQDLGHCSYLLSRLIMTVTWNCVLSEWCEWMSKNVKGLSKGMNETKWLSEGLESTIRPYCFKSQLYHLLAGWFWLHCFISVSLRVFISKVVLIVPPSAVCYEI